MNALVLLDRQVFLIPAIVSEPKIKPTAEGDPGRLEEVPVLHGNGCGLHLLPDFLLRLAGEGLSDLTAGAWIVADGYLSFPIGVQLPFSGNGLFVDAPGSRRPARFIFARHLYYPAFCRRLRSG